MKINFWIPIVVLMAIFLVIISIVILPWVLTFLGISLLPNPSKPEIKYGEFPFSLVYQINGETKTIEDTLVCEYAGIGMDEGTGKYRVWKEYFNSRNQKILLLNTDGSPGIVFSDKKTVKQEIYYDPGPAGYYMGDIKFYGDYNPNFPNASFFEQYADGSSSEGIINSEDLLNNYNIKLISWDCLKPVENKFS